MHVGKLQLDEIAKSFAHSAAHELQGSSPLYERLAMGVSTDPELLSLASGAISKPVPMIFLAAVHYLLLNDTSHPLAAFYPDINPESCNMETDPYPIFRDFCFLHRDEIGNLISTYHVQTNEVRRSACLLPAFGIVAKLATGLPLMLVEIGASAGLNLYWDHYGYDFGKGRFFGNRSSPVQLTCALRGDNLPRFPEIFPQIAARIGIDLNPIDLQDASAVNWLSAFIWPEHTARFHLLQHAIEIVRNKPPELHKGDVLEVLTDILDRVPPDSYPCLFHTFVSNQMSQESCDGLASIIADYGCRRDISCTSIDLADKYKYPRLELLSFTHGEKLHRHLANCSGHSRWMEWLLPAEENNNE